MFERLIKELHELEQTKQLSVPINADKEGYLDKECPNEECLFQFKINEDDWKTVINEEKVFCPLCRHEANSNSWWTTSQLEEAREQATKHILSRIDRALELGADDFNQQQSKNSFIQMSVSVSGIKPYHYILPIPAKEEMQLKIQCKECGVKYAIIGSAFFCPCCGHNSAEETFDNSIKKIEAKLKNLTIIRNAVEQVSKDEAETTCRSLVETSLSECIVAFQRFCEVAFSKKSPYIKLKFNAFQNLDIGKQYWYDLFGETYTDWISHDEFLHLNELFQKRHLLSHTEGMVDQKYLDKSGDKTYKSGQRIVIKEPDVLALIILIKRIVEVIRNKP